MIKQFARDLINFLLTIMSVIYQVTLLMTMIEYLDQHDVPQWFLIFIALCMGAFLYQSTDTSDSQK